MLKIKITRQILIAGEVAKAGDVVELDAATARSLIHQGVAELDAEATEQEAGEDDTVISTKKAAK